MSFYKVVKAIFKYPLSLMLGLRAYGTENIPEEGGFLICANHTSMIDVVVIAAGMKRQPHYMAKKEALSVPVIGPFLRSLGAFPVDRTGADVGAIKKAISLIDGGEVVCMFPQGHRYPKVAARTTAVHSGAGLIAYRAKCGVLPVYIKTKTGQVRFFHRTEVFFGPMIPSDALGFENGGGAEYKAAAESIFGAVCDIGAKNGAVLEIEAAKNVGDSGDE